METGKRFCRRCLTRESEDQEKVYESIKRMIEELEPEERTKSGEYGIRLQICKECDKLLSGMCKACGCYVELRAAMKQNSCPYHKWG